MAKEIISIDPRLIVNTRGVRPVTDHHLKTIRDGFVRNGYIATNLITCRTPTAREIADFYSREPYLCQELEAEERAQAELKKPDAGGHVYCIDGLHRRKVSLELIESHEFAEDFRLWGRLVKNLCAEKEIALSISLNSCNAFSIKLSPCSLVLQCNRYDRLVNCSARKKVLSAVEVGRRMVQCAGNDKQLSEKTVKAMAETRRQVIGISRKLPIRALKYLDSLQETDPVNAEAAYTIANLKAIPKDLTDEEAVSLLKRMNNFYKTQIPVPKSMPPHQVRENMFYVRRAINAIESFKTLCEYAALPNALEHLAGQMKYTDKHDESLADCSYEGEELYADLVLECERYVVGGVSRIMIARKKMSSKKANIPPESVSDPDTLGKGSISDNDENDNAHTVGTEEKSVFNQKSKNVSRSRRVEEIPALVPIEEQHASLREPPGWKLVNGTIEDFVKTRKEWDTVENFTDLAIVDIPKSEKNQDAIEKLIRHIGSCLKVSGVAHAFCAPTQFSQVVQAASKIGLTALSSPMLYVADASQTKRLTFSLQPQDIVEYAAVFYKKSHKASQKHYFSASEEFESSVTPPWTNVVSNISPSKNRLTDSNGKQFDISERSKDLYKYVLRQWCRPGGMCYNPLARTMAAGLAAYELGIRYIAVEANEECFVAARKRLLEFSSRPIKRAIFECSEKNSKQGQLIFKKKKALGSKSGVPKQHRNSNGHPETPKTHDVRGSEKEQALENVYNERSPEPMKYYPDRQIVGTDVESDESWQDFDEETGKCGTHSICAAAEECALKHHSANPTHTCGICSAPVHNLCDYGKRVMKDFSREDVFACSKKCYELEEQT